MLFAVISVPPKLSSSPDRTLNAGERASLTCSVIKGDLPMSMAWFKDGRAVDAQSVTITQLDQYNSILLIESLSQEHNGNYSCHARNAAAEVSYTTQLFVNGKRPSSKLHVAPCKTKMIFFFLHMLDIFFSCSHVCGFVFFLLSIQFLL